MQQTGPADPRFGYSSWYSHTNGQSMDQNAASDGETFFVTSLLFASARWGDNTGRFNYTAKALLIKGRRATA